MLKVCSIVVAVDCAKAALAAILGSKCNPDYRVCLDMCVDMCTDMCVDICMSMCTDMCTKCMDMCM